MNLHVLQGPGNHITTMIWYNTTPALIVVDTVVVVRHGGDGRVTRLVQLHNPPDETTRSEIL